MLKTAQRRLLALLLTSLMMIGMLPAAAGFDVSGDDFAPLVYDTEARLEKATELSKIDKDVLASQFKDKTVIDVRDTVVDMASYPASEEADYVASVASELTMPMGIIGLEDAADNDEVYVYIWLQELPDALDRVYKQESMSIMSYAEAASDADIARSLIRGMGTVSPLARSAPRLEIEWEYFEVFAGFAVRGTYATIKDIAEMDGVYGVSKVEYYTMDYTADPDYTTPGNAGAREIMEIADLHADGIDGSGIKVGVIDSGIDPTHPDLVDAYVTGYNFADKTADMTLADGSHGTHVSGTIASQGIKSLGVAPGVDLYMGQVFSRKSPNSASSADTTAAVEAFVKGDEEKGIPTMDIINMSMGNQVNSAYVEDHFVRNNAVIAGVLIVNSGGNNAYAENNTTDRKNYTLGSGGVSLPLSVAAAQYGGEAMITYNFDVTNDNDDAGVINFTVENGDGVLSALFTADSFGFTEAHEVTFDAENTTGNPAWMDAPYYNTYQRQPLTYVEGKGYELYYACSTNGEMSVDELADLKAMPADSLVGKILVVNRGQSFNDYLGEALRLGAGAVMVLNREESAIGNMTIGNCPAEHMSVLTGPQSGKDTLLAIVNAGEVAYMNPAKLVKKHHKYEPAAFSSIGPVNETAHIKPDVTGPGWSILSTSLEGGYEKMSGTSMSSPFVAGVAALVLQANPGISPAEIKARIMNTADPELIKPLSERLSNPGRYFDANGKETSVFEQGSGYVNPKRAVYGDVYITVYNEKVPTGQSGKEIMAAEMASFSFGVTTPDSVSDKLTATVHGGAVDGIKVIYNKDTRYSNKNLNDAVQVEYEINGDTFDAWLTISADANTSSRDGGNLYEGYILVTVGDEEYVLPWATRVGEVGEEESDFWLVYPDRPVQAVNGTPNQDWSPFSSYNYIYFMFEGKSKADSVELVVTGEEGNYTYTMYVYLFTAPGRELAYRIPITIATKQTDPYKPLSDFIEVEATYFAQTNGYGYAPTEDGKGWAATASIIQPGNYNLALLFPGTYNWYNWNGITFNDVRPVLTVDGFAFDDNYRTLTRGEYGVTEFTLDGSIYSEALAQASSAGFAWSGLYLMELGALLRLDQSFNVLVDAGSGDACAIDGDPFICDKDGNFELTFDIQADGYFFPEDFAPSGTVYATDAFNTSLISLMGMNFFIDFGSLTSYQWQPKTVVPGVVVLDAALTNGELTAQFMCLDGTIPAELNPEMLTAQMFVDGAPDQALGEFAYDPDTGIATWTFEPYKVKAFTPVILSAIVTYEEYYITTEAATNEAESIYIVDVTPSASVLKLSGTTNELTVVVTETYSDGSTEDYTEIFAIKSNSAGTFTVDDYNVYVNTKGNDQVRDCYLV